MHLLPITVILLSPSTHNLTGAAPRPIQSYPLDPKLPLDSQCSTVGVSAGVSASTAAEGTVAATVAAAPQLWL